MEIIKERYELKSQDFFSPEFNDDEESLTSEFHAKGSMFGVWGQVFEIVGPTFDFNY